MNSTGTVLGFQYQVLEKNNFGVDEVIEEMFIPSHKIIVNGNNHYFYGKQPRHDYRTRDLGEIKIIPPLKEIEVSLELVEKIDQLMKQEVAKKNEIQKDEEAIRQVLEKLWI